jgi:hypothetical protein
MIGRRKFAANSRSLYRPSQQSADSVEFDRKFDFVALAQRLLVEDLGAEDRRLCLGREISGGPSQSDRQSCSDDDAGLARTRRRPLDDWLAIVGLDPRPSLLPTISAMTRAWLGPSCVPTRHPALRLLTAALQTHCVALYLPLGPRRTSNVSRSPRRMLGLMSPLLSTRI